MMASKILLGQKLWGNFALCRMGGCRSGSPKSKAISQPKGWTTNLSTTSVLIPQSVERSEPSEVKEIRQGAFESMQEGRPARLVPRVTGRSIWPLRRSTDACGGTPTPWPPQASMCPGVIDPQGEVANVEVAVGYRSGSHFSPPSKPWKNVYSRQRSNCTSLVVPCSG